MTHVLVTRAAAARWQSLGKVTEAPLLAMVPRQWTPPQLAPEAIALTSANAVRYAGDDAAPYRGLPAFAVGPATAAAAATTGWRDVREGGGTAASLFATIAAAGFTTVLHLAGVDRTAVAVPASLSVAVREVYEARRLDLPNVVLDACAAGTIDLVVLYSPRAALHFAAQIDAVAAARSSLALVVLSAAVGNAAGPGWRVVTVAATPDDDALFAAAAAMCDKAI